MYPNDRYYSKEHEWVLLQSDEQALVGITAYAQEHLGDVVFVEMPELGTTLNQFQKLGEIESVKAVSDIFMPLDGNVTEVNIELSNHPELINEDPHGKGWIARIATVDQTQVKNLLSAKEYETLLSQIE